MPVYFAVAIAQDATKPSVMPFPAMMPRVTPARGEPVSKTPMNRLSSITVVALCCIAQPAAGQRPLDRVVGQFPSGNSVDVGLPLNAFEIAHALDRIASSAHVLIGFEAVPGEPWPPTRPRSTAALTGMTVGQALQFIVTTDSRYRWDQDGDVVHVRPRVQTGVLTRAVSGFGIEDKTAFEAMITLCAALRHDDNLGYATSGVTPSELAQRRFTVPTMSGTLLEVLDQIAIRHGALSWHVGAPADPGAPIRLGFTVFDGWGTSSPECAR